MALVVGAQWHGPKMPKPIPIMTPPTKNQIQTYQFLKIETRNLQHL